MNARPSPELITVIESADRILLLCHRRPDGDALGSTLGLGLPLEQRGQHVTYLCADPVPARYQFLPGAEKFITDPAGLEFDLVVMLDCGAERLTGFDLAADFPGRPVVELDHHQKQGVTPSGRLTFFDATAASTAELVLRVIEQAGWPVSRHVATNLLAGIVTDTQAFQTSNTTSETLAAAGQLLRHGARLKTIISHCFYTSSVPKLRLWGRAMARIEQNTGASGIVSTVLTYDDIVECGAHPDDIEGLVNFLNAIPGVPALMLLTDLQQGEIKGSLRTRRDRIDVAKLAGLFGGGGHRQAAGFTVRGTLSRNPDDSWTVLPA